MSEHKLPATALLTAARLAQEIGLVSAAARLLLTHAPPWAIRRLRDNGAVFTEVDAVLRSLIACHPAVALRVLRQSRPRAVRCDDEETDDNRRELLVLCLEGLGRKNHAARLKRSQS